MVAVPLVQMIDVKVLLNRSLTLILSSGFHFFKILQQQTFIYYRGLSPVSKVCRPDFKASPALYSLVVQFVAESRFANCEFANLFFDFDELQFS